MKFPPWTLPALLHELTVLQINRISIFPCRCRLSLVFSATGASTTLQAVGLQPVRSIDMRWGQTSSDEISMPRSDWSCRSAQMHVWEGEGLILSHLVFLILRLLSYSRVRSELCIFTPQAPPPPPPQPSVCQFSANCVRARGDAPKKKWKKKANVWHANALKFSLQIDWLLSWYFPFGGLNCHTGCSLSVLVKCSYSPSLRSEHSP